MVPSVAYRTKRVSGIRKSFKVASERGGLDSRRNRVLGQSAVISFHTETT